MVDDDGQPYNFSFRSEKEGTETLKPLKVVSKDGAIEKTQLLKCFSCFESGEITCMIIYLVLDVCQRAELTRMLKSSRNCSERSTMDY